jgi:hypothetical protein
MRSPIILAQAPQRQMFKDGHDSRDDDNRNRISPIIGPRSVEYQHKSIERIAEQVRRKRTGYFATSSRVRRSVCSIARVQKPREENIANAN